MRYVDVIVPLAVEGMYTYTVPVSLESEVREGTLVLVSFAGNKRYTALVVVVSFSSDQLAMSVMLAWPKELQLKMILRLVLSKPSFFTERSINCKYLPLTWVTQ